MDSALRREQTQHAAILGQNIGAEPMNAVAFRRAKDFPEQMRV